MNSIQHARIAAALAACLFACCAHGEIYKCVRKGQTSYAERPCEDRSSTVPIETEERNKRRAVEDAAKLQSLLEQDDEAKRIAQKYQERSRQTASREARCRALMRDASASKEAISMWDDPILVYAAKARYEATQAAYIKDCTGVWK